MATLPWLQRAVPTPRVPAPFRRSVELPPTEQRWPLAVLQLELTLSSWGIPSHLAGHWLHEAEPLMAGPEPLALALELDPVEDLVTIELTDERGKCVFGIDAYLQAPELSR